MIRKKKTNNSKIIIDITGPEGNVFCLMGYAEKFAKQLGIDRDSVINEMMAGDYENLLRVFDGYFGAFVILER